MQTIFAERSIITLTCAATGAFVEVEFWIVGATVIYIVADSEIPEPEGVDKGFAAKGRFGGVGADGDEGLVLVFRSKVPPSKGSKPGRRIGLGLIFSVAVTMVLRKQDKAASVSVV